MVGRKYGIKLIHLWLFEKEFFGVRPHPLVEHSAVNRAVVGSSPTRGVEKSP